MKGEEDCDIRDWRGKCFPKSNYLDMVWGVGGVQKKARIASQDREDMEIKVGR